MLNFSVPRIVTLKFVYDIGSRWQLLFVSEKGFCCRLEPGSLGGQKGTIPLSQTMLWNGPSPFWFDKISIKDFFTIEKVIWKWEKGSFDLLIEFLQVTLPAKCQLSALFIKLDANSVTRKNGQMSIKVAQKWVQ